MNTRKPAASDKLAVAIVEAFARELARFKEKRHWTIRDHQTVSEIKAEMRLAAKTFKGLTRNG